MQLAPGSAASQPETPARPLCPGTGGLLAGSRFPVGPAWAS